MSAAVLAIATSTGEAITTGALAGFFALLSWAGFHRRRVPLGCFYLAATVLAVVVTVLAAAGHVFRGL